MTEESRGEAMAGRLRRTALRRGLDEEGADRLIAAYRLALGPRSGLDDHHPDFLHPARTALILLDDVGIGDADVLAAGALCESRDPALRVPFSAALALGGRTAALLEAVPVPAEAGESLLERLLTAEPDVARIALAERLDHDRHLHLRPRAEWGADHALGRDVYVPLAARVDATLGRRYRWWCDTFERRYASTG